MRELTMKEEQAVQLEMLKLFDHICKEEHLTYYLAYGTLLGAAREHGFIEWDDDVDLWMKREDYDKFAKVFDRYAPDRYFLQTYQTDKRMPVPGMTRICVNDSFKWPMECINQKFHTGIYFDIFPLDYSNADKEKDAAVMKKCSMAYEMLWRKLNIKRKELMTLKRRIFTAFCNLFPRSILRNTILSANKCEKKDESSLVCYPSSPIYPGNIFDAKLFESVVYLDFEDMKCPCPVGYEQLLTDRYGDWRTPAKDRPRYTQAYWTK